MIKDVLNQVLSESGYLTQANFFGSTDVDNVQMAAIANRVRAEIRDYFRWPDLRKEYELQLVSGVAEYTLPFDFVQLIPESVWETDGARKATWPTSDHKWYMYKFSGFSSGGDIKIKRTGRQKIEVALPLEGDKISFEYASTATVIDADTGNLKNKFEKDNDGYILRNQTLALGIQAHWAITKMLPQASIWMQNYREKLAQDISIVNDSSVIGGTSLGPSRGAPYYPLYRPS